MEDKVVKVENLWYFLPVPSKYIMSESPRSFWTSTVSCVYFMWKYKALIDRSYGINVK
jgi:hypothetical protein